MDSSLKMRPQMMTHLGMRGFASMSVVAYHYSQLLMVLPWLAETVKAIEAAQWFIDAFFVLSGFIMGSLYAEKLYGGGMTAWQYYRARFARIYPLHLLTMLWMIVVLLKLGTPWGELSGPALRQLFLVHGWGLTDAYYLNHPTWSISGEMAAYLIFPLIAGVIVRRGPGLVGLGIAGLALLGAFVWLVEVQGVAWERLTLFRALSGFLFGIVLSRMGHFSAGISDRLTTTLQLSLTVLLFAGMFLGAKLAVMLPILAALIFLTRDDRGALAWFFVRPSFQRLGILSYGIYMLHIPVVFTGFLFWGKFVGELSTVTHVVAFVILCTGTTVLLSWISFRFFEMPFRALLRPKRHADKPEEKDAEEAPQPSAGW
jgi:peptidoglycan/LPS O-acetylase OafA/YrhL